jgi:hypothetical protein
MKKKAARHKELHLSVKLLIMGLYIAGSLLLFYHLANTDITPTALAENSGKAAAPAESAAGPSTRDIQPQVTSPLSPLYPVLLFLQPPHEKPGGGLPPCSAGACILGESTSAPTDNDSELSASWAGGSRAGPSARDGLGKPPGEVYSRDLPFPLTAPFLSDMPRLVITPPFR